LTSPGIKGLNSIVFFPPLVFLGVPERYYFHFAQMEFPQAQLSNRNILEYLQYEQRKALTICIYQRFKNLMMPFVIHAIPILSGFVLTNFKEQDKISA